MAQEEEIYDQGGYEDEIPMEGTEDAPANQSAEVSLQRASACRAY